MLYEVITNQVTIFEKNNTIGGRARQLKKQGFTFDIGPTWYWMPDVFERFFGDFEKLPSDYYQLEKLRITSYNVCYTKLLRNNYCKLTSCISWYKSSSMSCFFYGSK